MGTQRNVAVYTIGYGGWPIDAVETLVRGMNAILVDVRMVPASRMPQWSAKRLGARFAGSYLHLREFGNVNYKAGIEKMRIADYAAGRKRLEQLPGGRPLVLMCGCRSLNDCHRRHLAARLAVDWQCSVTHLPPPPKPAKPEPPGLFDAPEDKPCS